MKNGKKALYLVALVALIAAAFFVFQSLTKNSPTSQTLGDGLAGDPSIDSKDDTEGGSMSYKDAVAQFKDKRIALNTACGAIPKSLTIANNSKLMIDNRSPIDRIIKVGSIMNIKAYSFKIVDVAVPGAPSVLTVDCDKYLSVATISVGK